MSIRELCVCVTSWEGDGAEMVACAGCEETVVWYIQPSEQPGHSCRAFSLHTVHLRSPKLFLIPFFVPLHHRHTMKPLPPHSAQSSQLFMSAASFCVYIVGIHRGEK